MDTSPRRTARHPDARQDLERRPGPQDLHRHPRHHGAAKTQGGRWPDPAGRSGSGNLSAALEQRDPKLSREAC